MSVRRDSSQGTKDIATDSWLLRMLQSSFHIRPWVSLKPPLRHSHRQGPQRAGQEPEAQKWRLWGLKAYVPSLIRPPSWEG